MVKRYFSNCCLISLFIMFLINTDIKAAQDKVIPADQTQNATSLTNPPELKFDWKKTPLLKKMLKQGELENNHIPNPHWQDNSCLACHNENGRLATRSNLNSAKPGDTCLYCHDSSVEHSYIHPVDIEPSATMASNIDHQYRQSLLMTGEKVNCITCHDLTLQCLPEKRKEQAANPRFFRGGPFKTRSEQCFFCHNEKQYIRLNPHDQIDEKGKLNVNSCKICHPQSIEALDEAYTIEQVRFNLDKNLEKMCWGCHKWVPHPGGQFSFYPNHQGPDHLVVPSQYIKDTMKKMTTKFNVFLPLEPGSGRVFCGTCHNPHEKGVLKNSLAEMGADSKGRLRAENICQFCHLK